MKKKVMAAALASALCIAIGIGGTLAWLTDTSGPVQNTFTSSDIDITLTETDSQQDTDGDANTNSYKMIPGHTITKNPKVTVKAGSEPCYLFVKVEKSTDPKFDDFMTCTILEGWELVPDETNVYYKEVTNSETGKEKDVLSANKEFVVIKDNTVTVKDDVTKEMMKNLTASKQPTLKITAYATQLYERNNTKFDVGDAWEKVNPTPNS